MEPTVLIEVSIAQTMAGILAPRNNREIIWAMTSGMHSLSTSMLKTTASLGLESSKQTQTRASKLGSAAPVRVQPLRYTEI